LGNFIDKKVAVFIESVYIKFGSMIKYKFYTHDTQF